MRTNRVQAKANIAWIRAYLEALSRVDLYLSLRAANGNSSCFYGEE